MAKSRRRVTDMTTMPQSAMTSMRLDSRLRYLAELGARQERRTLAGLMERALEEYLPKIRVNETTSLDALADQLWSIDPGERLAKLAFHAPQLMTHDEQARWLKIKETSRFWKERTRSGRSWPITEENLDTGALRAELSGLQISATGVSNLPSDSIPKKTGGE